MPRRPPPGEEALFTTSTAPDALILLDLSGSMAWNPAGSSMPFGSSNSCTADTANCTGTGCSGGFCTSSKSGTTFYANSSCTVPDYANCQGSGCSLGFCGSSHSSSTFYAHSSCSTPDTLNCTDVPSASNCNRSDGFCASSTAAGLTYYAASSCTTPDTYNCNGGRWTDCSGGFCASSHSYSSRRINYRCQVPCTTTGCTTSCAIGSCSVSCTSGGCSSKCSRLDIAKRAIFNILDDNNDNVINSSDEGSLGVRIGYMRYYGCGDDESSLDYTTGCNTLIRAIGSKYSLIYCNSSSSCSSSDGYNSCTSCVNGEHASGGTPIGSALSEAKLYLDANKAADSAKNCRQKFLIFITDGSDTFSCGASGAECDVDRYQTRRESVAQAKALADAGYKVFVIGFGASMPSYLQNTLNWMAYYGGTDNPNAPNSGSTTAYSIPSGSLYPSNITSCMDESTPVAATCYDSSGQTGSSQTDFRASANDPGYLNLSGYAFLATDADALAAAIKTAMNIIREATYSFSQSSVQSSRTTDENFLYEGSFQPVSGDPFWLGHLKKYQINSDGTVGSMLWDAGDILKTTDASTRNMKTYTGGALVDFTTANMTASILGVTTTAQRDAIVGYFRGVEDSTCPTSGNCYDPDNWKLGDVFRSTPITVGTPSVFFDDIRDTSGPPNAFATFRTNHPRTSANGNRLIVAGANDGQFHAFKTSDGTEAWSFIPPNLLSKLVNIAHSSEPTSLTHQYFVDGPVTVADVWLGSGNGTSKSASDWKTLLVFGEGRGSTGRTWSSSSSCDSGLVGNYDSSHTNYCGYFALDITSSLSPAYLWNINTFNATTQAPYLGDSWSKMMIGRVLINVGGVAQEKWVGFIGGGYNGGNCKGGGTCDTRGKGFFVIDLSSGAVLWSYTMSDNSNMVYSIPAEPAIVDTDNDGFIDTAYVGDLGSNMWRFKFCRSSDMPNCGTANWSGGLLFDASSGNIRPIFTSAAVAKDTGGNLWVYWGTGDKTDPTASNAQEQFYGLKDNDRTSTYTFSSISNITSSSQTYDPQSSNDGYRILFTGGGEKMLADPTVFGGVVYFTTFTPASGNDPCNLAGASALYGINYTTGGGALPGSARSMSIGSGIASSPVVSLKPGGGTTPDLYVTVSGGGTTGASTSRVNINPPGVSNKTNMLYWLDKRIQ